MPNYDIVPKAKRHKPFQQPDKHKGSPMTKADSTIWSKEQIDSHLMSQYGHLNPDPVVRDRLANLNTYRTGKQFKALDHRLG